ncbi:DNA ligase [Marinobacterium sp. YM272]|uniref:DNA ligase n=1 Tax=Marinobacterium sp. YM272 TaxID=3421654 RepID=UPI003D7F88B2
MSNPPLWAGATLAFVATPVALAATQAPALMSAESLTPEQTIDSQAYFVSEKLDGVRARWSGQVLLTRSGLRIHAADTLLEQLPPVPLDAELWLGRGRFSETSGLIHRADAGDPLWDEVQLRLFDLPAHPGTFETRLAALNDIAAAVDNSAVSVIEQTRGLSRAEIDNLLEQTRQTGGEGLMLHHASARYTHSRSSLLLKYKGYEDAEARVVGYTPGKGKYEGMTGALIVETKAGLRFRIGSGLSDEERASPPKIGSLVTYRFNGLTSQGKPRFARFMRIYDPQI